MDLWFLILINLLFGKLYLVDKIISNDFFVLF